MKRNQRGANLVEYLLLLAFIAIIVLVAVKALGENPEGSQHQAPKTTTTIVAGRKP